MLARQNNLSYLNDLGADPERQLSITVKTLGDVMKQRRFVVNHGLASADVGSMNSSAIRFDILLRIAAWACLAGIAFATLSPIGLRPTTGVSPSIERFAAFALVGALFAAAYPRYILFAAAIVIGAAVLLELIQLLEPSRHGRLFDASVKLAGGTLGLAAGSIVGRWLRRR
ncbi:hypothetical protein [Rhodopseudomonas palustris]